MKYILIVGISISLGLFLGIEINKQKCEEIRNQYISEQFNFITELYENIDSTKNLDSIIESKFYLYEKQFIDIKLSN